MTPKQIARAAAKRSREVRRMRPMAWADFKHRLYRAGHLSSPVADVPVEWQEAFISCYRKAWKPWL